ncbi:MAG: hypothetical protein HYX47_00280 [Burkholderiales bacterium]|nr:hypothetical protein [Burkholderiales bacterium]
MAEGKLRPVFGMDKAVQVKAHFAVYPERLQNVQQSKRFSDGCIARRRIAETTASVRLARVIPSAPSTLHVNLGCCRFSGHLVKVEMKPEVVHGNEKAIQPGVQA